MNYNHYANSLLWFSHIWPFFGKVPLKVLLIMKITILLICVLSFQSLADALAQKVNLNVSNQSLKSVIRLLQKQSGYSFVLEHRLLTQAEPVTLSLQNVEIKDAFPLVFANQPFSYMIEGNIVYLTPKRHATTGSAQTLANSYGPSLQQRVISGRVIDINGTPLAGVTVSVKGTANGTITDSDGRFTLADIPPNGIIQFSFVGMKTKEMAIGNKATLQTVMEAETIGLDEAVVIGYGTVKKSDLTGAISQIDPTKKVERLTSNATDILRNNVAGLYIPFSTSAKGDVNMGNTLIRGTTSLKASNAPLIVLDGMIFEGDLANISAGDIERIDVMKDASSAAVYGSRSANGVIQITTKKGTIGTPTINLTITAGAARPSFIRPSLSPEGYIDMRRNLLQYTAPRNNQPGYYDNPDNLPPGVSLSQWLAYSNATGDPTDIWLTRLALQDVEITNYKAGKTINWADQVFSTGLRQDYLASINGGTDRIKYYWSVNYTNNEGYVVGQEYGSVRSRLNIESKIAGFLSVGLNTQYANRDESGIQAVWRNYSRLSPYGSMFNDDGTRKYTPYDEPMVRNPLIDRDYNEAYDKSNDLSNKIYTYITLPFGITYQFNAINQFEQNRAYSHTSAAYPGNATNGEAARSNIDTWLWNVENIVKWNEDFGSHNFDLTLLANSEKYQHFSNIQSNTQFSPSDILKYHDMAAGSVPVISSDDFVRTRDALLGRLNYSFKNRYLLTASIRRDGYSAFGQDNPHAFFPSLALAWRISDEPFFSISSVNDLKLRASWGANGNSSIGEYSALATLLGNKHLYANENGAAYTVSRLVINRMANAGLQWEKTIAYNVGLDFSLFDSRLNGNLEGYLSKTTNLLVDRSLPNVTGYERIASNLGQVDNSGIEITLNSVNWNIPGHFKWQTAINASFNKNKIARLYGDMVNVYDDNGAVIGTKEADDYNNGWFIGRAIEAIWDYKPNGVWQIEDLEAANKAGYLPGEYRMVDVNGDGIYTELADKQFLGYSRPQFRWNMMNDFTLFEHFSLSFSVYGHHGWKKNHIEKFGNERESDFVIPYWTEENRSNQWARMSNRDVIEKPQSNYIDMGFVRISDIAVGYQFPTHAAERLRVQSLKLFGSVQNAAVWSDWPGWDPENTDGPVPRFFNFGINVKL